MNPTEPHAEPLLTVDKYSRIPIYEQIVEQVEMHVALGDLAPEDQLLVQHQLAAMLRAVISQRLLPHRSEEALVPVYELLLNNTAVANQIRKSEYAQLATNIELGRSEGMVLLEESLALQVRAGRIAPHVALAAANQPERLQKLLM